MQKWVPDLSKPITSLYEKTLMYDGRETNEIIYLLRTYLPFKIRETILVPIEMSLNQNFNLPFAQPKD